MELFILADLNAAKNCNRVRSIRSITTEALEVSRGVGHVFDNIPEMQTDLEFIKIRFHSNMNSRVY